MPTHPRASRHPGRPARAASAVAALLTVGGWIIGLPVLLWHIGGNPIPIGISLDGIRQALTRPDDGTVLVQVLVVAGWIVWIWFCGSLAAELVARLAGRQLAAPPGMRTQRRIAGLLIGAIAAIAAPTAAHAGQEPATPAPVTAPLGPEDDQPPHPGDSDTAPQPEYVQHLVVRGEALLDLQQRYDVSWQRIAQANYGTVQPDGRALQPGQTRIYPGWQVRIPTSQPPPATTPLTAGDQQRDNRPTPPRQDEQMLYEVAAGDWLWHIADRTLGDPQRYREIAELNPEYDGRHSSHPAGHPDRITFPDYIEPGWRLTLPADADDRGPRPHGTGTVHHPEPRPGTGQPTPPEPEPPETISPTPTPAPAGPRPATPTPPPASPTPPEATRPPATPTLTAPPSTPAAATPAATAPATPTGSAAPAAPGGDDAPGDQRGPGVLVPVAFGAALIVATLAAAATVRLRRRGASADPRVGRTGHRSDHRPSRVNGGRTDQALQVASQPADIDRLDAALRTLGAALAQRQHPLPDIIGLHIESGNLHLLLTTPSAPAEPPWRLDVIEGPHWSLQAGQDLPPADEQLAALPTLVTVGSRADPAAAGPAAAEEHLLLDLERLGVLAIGGEPEPAGDLLRYLASELAMNSWADEVEVILAGWPEAEAAQLHALNPDRVHLAGSITEAANQLRQRVTIAAGILTAAGATDALHGRVADLAGDSWMPTVLLAAAPPPEAAAALADLAADLARVGRCAIAAVATGSLPRAGEDADAVHTITVAADRTVTIPFLGTTMAAAGLPPHELQPLAQVIATAREGHEEPVPPAPEPEPWANGTDAAGSLLPPKGLDDLHFDAVRLPAPELDAAAADVQPWDWPDTATAPEDDTDDDPHPTPPVHQAHEHPPGVQQQVLPDTPTPTPTNGIHPAGAGTPTRATPAPAPPPAEAGHPDPDLDNDLAAWHQAGTPDRPLIRILGPVVEPFHVIFAPGEPPKPGRLLLLAEVLVYLAQRGARGADPRRLDEDIWPGQDVQVSYRRATLSRARQWAGRRTDQTPWLAEAHYRLEPGFLLDWHLFRRLRARGQARGPAGADDLRAALELVQGQPLEGYERIASTTRAPYSWLPTSDIDPDHIIAAIVDTAHELAQLHLAAGDTAAARWAVQRAWLADPDRHYDQPWRDLLQAQAADGHAAELAATVRELMRRREAEVEEDLDPETFQLLHQLLPSRHWEPSLQPAS